MIMSSSKLFKKDFIYEDIYYTLDITEKEKMLEIRLSEYLELNIWELNTNLEAEKKEFSLLTLMDISHIIESILGCLEANSYKLVQKNDDVVLEFWVEMMIGKKSQKQNFSFTLKSKAKSIIDNIKVLSSHLKKIDKSLDSFKEAVQIKLNDLKNEFKDSQNVFCENTLRRIDIKIKEIEDKTNLFCDNQKLLFDMDFDKNGEKLYPKIINPNNLNYLITNEGRSVEKIKGGNSWFGFRFEEIPYSKDRYSFSIKIDNCDYNSYFMIGYCLNTHNPSLGYYNNECLGAFYLYNGCVYYPSERGTNFRGSKGIVITSVIDLKLQMMYFILNGIVNLNYKLFNINKADKSKVCPFIDIYTQGDKISIIEF